ncbi:hypothetical protein HJFPF1_09312 [Paramyrothecium foliicola]|nr:hypothetical protein HJFPF1_09312 [Paramyrothecium foliicola]
MAVSHKGLGPYWDLGDIDQPGSTEDEDNVTLGVPASDYATSWICEWSDPEKRIWTHEDLELLRHVNCSYLSSGKLPTLLALKQHAQSLTNLIRKLCVSSTAGKVNGKGLGPTFRKNDAFDWLNDLDTPYQNTDDAHNTPLEAIANKVKGEIEAPIRNTLELHCPLQPILDSGPFIDKEQKESKSRPYQTHAGLLHHANECLEILDHEYGATGGLLSILPTNEEHDKPQMAGARNTLVGQWLLHHQHLIARMHELEISYANALDALAGEAVVPLQLLSSSGLDARSVGRAVAYPQDRFVLVHSGDELFNHIHRLLDREEASSRAEEQTWRNSGVVGERLRAEDRRGEEFTRGLVSIDATSRFYRLKGQGGGKGPLFVLPAIDEHPGVQQTRIIEKRQTVVSVVTPTWPERMSDLQRKHEEKLEEGDKAIQMKRVLLKDREERKKTLLKLMDDKNVSDRAAEAARTEAEGYKELWLNLRAGFANLRDMLPDDVRGYVDAYLEHGGLAADVEMIDR